MLSIATVFYGFDMLETLSRIVQEVSATKNLDEALLVLVKLVKEAIETEACSVFLVDEDRGEYVLMATEGLNTSLAGVARLRFGDGLVGLVGERGEPLNVVDASSHPHAVDIPDLGEDSYHAFLGIPIVHQRQLVGVLVVQQSEPRLFDEPEVAFLVTLSAQMAGTIAYALATGAVKAFSKIPTWSRRQTTFSGFPSAPGVVIGAGVVVYPTADLDAVPERPAEDLPAEIELLKSSIALAREDVQRLNERMASTLPPEERALFDVYLRILDSASLLEEIINEINEGCWAQAALKHVIKQRVKQFENMDDPYLRERAVDLQDLGERVLSHMQRREKSVLSYPEQTILVGEDVTPAALAEVPEGRLAGVISARGSSSSHLAILARALGIPAVMGLSSMPVAAMSGRQLIVDGYSGEVYVSPSPEVRDEFLRLGQEERDLDAELEGLRDLPAETPDGYQIKMCVNTGLAADVGYALSVGAEGVGLYRTEIPFLARDRFPSEEEQRVIYRQLLKAFSPRTVTMRTLDVGGDKSLSYFPVKEENPFLGWRGIRVTLDHPEIFLTQLRAMLRASLGLNNLQIMLPMISGIAEVEESQRLLRQAFEEIQKEDPDVVMPPLGMMVEVPSSVYQARELAKRVDFMSVGSNDLIQYLLAVDRNNSRVASLYDGMHPSVLHALQAVVHDAHKENIEISICGEMASDPAAVVLLLAMGFDSLSLNATRLPRMKWVVRKVTIEKARQLLKEILDMDDPVEIRDHLDVALEELGLVGLIRAGN